MAQGTLVLFDEFLDRKNDGTHAFGSHTFKAAMITTLPVATQTTPQLGDYTEVSGSNYTAGGITLAMDISRSGNVWKLDSTVNPEWLQHASGPANCMAVLLYNDTDASDRAIGFIDLSTDNGTTPISLQTQDILINFNASNGIYTETRT